MAQRRERLGVTFEQRRVVATAGRYISSIKRLEAGIAMLGQHCSPQYQSHDRISLVLT